jgi:hypothetical protein
MTQLLLQSFRLQNVILTMIPQTSAQLLFSVGQMKNLKPALTESITRYRKLFAAA